MTYEPRPPVHPLGVLVGFFGAFAVAVASLTLSFGLLLDGGVLVVGIVLAIGRVSFWRGVGVGLIAAFSLILLVVGPCVLALREEL
jgi:hypothetical protein